MTDECFLSGDDIDLRPLRDDDVPTLRTATNRPEVWTMTGDLHPTSDSEAREIYTERCEADDEFLFVMDDGTGPVGQIRLKNLNRQSGTGRVSYFVVPDHHGNGYATEAVSLVVGYAFEHLRLHKVRANTLDENEASRRVLEKVGFTKEGTDREGVYIMDDHRDIYKWGILEHEWRNAE